jgi:hypothetical protein
MELKDDLRVGHRLDSLTSGEIMTGTAEDHVRPAVPILSQKNPAYTLTANFCEIHFNITFPSRPTSSSGIFT